MIIVKRIAFWIPCWIIDISYENLLKSHQTHWTMGWLEKNRSINHTLINFQWYLACESFNTHNSWKFDMRSKDFFFYFFIRFFFILFIHDIQYVTCMFTREFDIVQNQMSVCFIYENLINQFHTCRYVK